MAIQARDADLRKDVAEDQQVMTGNPVRGHRRMHIHKGILFDDPEGRMALRLYRIVADVLEDIAGDLESEIGLVPALGFFATARADVVRMPLYAS